MNAKAVEKEVKRGVVVGMKGGGSLLEEVEVGSAEESEDGKRWRWRGGGGNRGRTRIGGWLWEEGVDLGPLPHIFFS